LQAALEGAARITATPEHKVQIAMAAVYRGVIWRQGFVPFSVRSIHQK